MRAATQSEFARSPGGRFVAGPTWAHFCAHPRLWGMVLWGRPTEADAIRLGRSLVLELDRGVAEPHASLVDASRLEAGDEGAFGALQRYVDKHWAALQRSVTKLALVRPPGFLGAFVAGAYEVMPRPYPVAVFEDARAAFTWLSVPGAGTPASLTRELQELHAEITGASPLLTSLRSWLEANLDGPRIADAAKALELSQRTLQRRLGEAETTFPREVMAARVRAAQRLLVARDAKLSTIAVEAGFASLQQLNTVFRRATGRSPRQFRAEQRPTAQGSSASLKPRQSK